MAGYVYFLVHRNIERMWQSVIHCGKITQTNMQDMKESKPKHIKEDTTTTPQIFSLHFAANIVDVIVNKTELKPSLPSIAILSQDMDQLLAFFPMRNRFLHLN